MLGDIAENRQEWQEAWQLYSRAVKEEPDEAVCHFKLGHLAFRLQNFPVAEKHLRLTLQLNKQQPVAWNDLGFIAARTGSWQNAVNCFENAVTLAPENPGYERNLNIARRMAAKVTTPKSPTR